MSTAEVNAAAAGPIGERLRLLRTRSGMSVRQLGKNAGVSEAMVSYVERGVHSPSMVTLQKLLDALGISFAEFFSDGNAAANGPVRPREQMRVIGDADRTYAILFGSDPQVRLEMFDEHIRVGASKPEFSSVGGDLAGYIISGTLALEVEGESEPRLVRTGDAFYLPAGTVHRGYAVDDTVRLVSVTLPHADSTH